MPVRVNVARLVGFCILLGVCLTLSVVALSFVVDTASSPTGWAEHTKALVLCAGSSWCGFAYFLPRPAPAALERALS